MVLLESHPTRVLRVTQGERESSVAQGETLAKRVAGMGRPDRLVNNSVQLLMLRDLGAGVFIVPNTTAPERRRS